MRQYKKLSLVLRRKTSKFLKISMLFLIVSLILVSSGSFFLLKQYNGMQHEWTKNQNMHVIQVNLFENGTSNYRNLKFSDKDKVKKILEKNFSGKYKICMLYSIPCSITDKENQSYFIQGMDQNAIILLNESNIQNNVAYQENPQSKSLVLSIPKVDVREGGFQSAESSELRLELKSLDTRTNPLTLYSNQEIKSPLYVNEDTFKTCIQMMFGVQWKDFQQQYDADNPFQMNIVERFLIYVDDLENVDAIAQELEIHGYPGRYTIQAFDQPVDMLSILSMFAIVFLVLLVVISFIFVWLAFRMYYKVQQKDMGILRHMGYTIETVQKAYISGLNHMFLKIGFVIIFFTVLEGTAILGIRNSLEILLVLCLEFGLLILLWFIICKMIKKYVKKDILFLLRASKETE